MQSLKFRRRCYAARLFLRHLGWVFGTLDAGEIFCLWFLVVVVMCVVMAVIP